MMELKQSTNCNLLNHGHSFQIVLAYSSYTCRKRYFLYCCWGSLNDYKKISVLQLRLNINQGIKFQILFVLLEFIVLIVISHIINQSMDRQFRVHTQNISQIGFRSDHKDSKYDSNLFNRMKYENYLIFEPELFEKKLSCYSLDKKSKYLDQLLFETKKNCSLKIKQVSHGRHHSENSQPENKSLQLKHSHQNFFKGSYNRVLTRACLTRNQRKKEKLFGCKSKFSYEQKSPQLKGETKILLPRQEYMEQVNKKSKEDNTGHYKNCTSSKLFFKITKKKKKLSKCNYFEEAEKQISGWEYQNQVDFQL